MSTEKGAAAPLEAELAAMSLPERSAALVAMAHGQLTALAAMDPEQQAAALVGMDLEEQAATLTQEDIHSLAGLPLRDRAAALVARADEQAAAIAAMSLEQQVAAVAGMSPQDRVALPKIAAGCTAGCTVSMAAVCPRETNATALSFDSIDAQLLRARAAALVSLATTHSRDLYGQGTGEQGSLVYLLQRQTSMAAALPLIGSQDKALLVGLPLRERAAVLVSMADEQYSKMADERAAAIAAVSPEQAAANLAILGENRMSEGPDWTRMSLRERAATLVAMADEQVAMAQGQLAVGAAAQWQLAVGAAMSEQHVGSQPEGVTSPLELVAPSLQEYATALVGMPLLDKAAALVAMADDYY